jgi:hypothetical protein
MKRIRFVSLNIGKTPDPLLMFEGDRLLGYGAM